MSGATLALGIHAALAYSPEAPSYQPQYGDAFETRFRTWDEHDRIRALKGTPYLLQFSDGRGQAIDGAESLILEGISTEDRHGWISVLAGSRVPDGAALLYYGAAHQDDLHHPQAADIEARWNAFEPTVALCEGRNRGYFVSSLIERFAGRPEPAVVHGLARRDDVRLLSLEASVEAEVSELLTRWPAESLLIYYTLRVYAAESGGSADLTLAEHLLNKRRKMPGLQAALPDLDALDAHWNELGYPAGNWATLSHVPASGPLAEINTDVQHTRGRHMVRTLAELTIQGERVFAVVGSGHVIRQEWTLRQALGAAPADDQPYDAQD